jgi:hypothetical protein
MVRLVFIMINEMAFVKILKKNSIFSPHISKKSIITTYIAKCGNAIKMILAYLPYLPLSKQLPSLG